LKVPSDDCVKEYASGSGLSFELPNAYNKKNKKINIEVKENPNWEEQKRQ